MNNLLKEIRSCTVCADQLPLGPRPVIEASRNSKIVLISQAPGRVVHENGVAWKDKSGEKLREWLGVDEKTFYQTANFAVLPMGFCYPGKATSGDKPPRKECAPLWHDRVWKEFENVQLKITIGGYASKYYLNSAKNLTENVLNFEEYLPEFWPLPHPSPVNRFWRIKNPWFEAEVVPQLQKRISRILSD